MVAGTGYDESENSGAQDPERREYRHKQRTLPVSGESLSIGPVDAVLFSLCVELLPESRMQLTHLTGARITDASSFRIGAHR